MAEVADRRRNRPAWTPLFALLVATLHATPATAGAQTYQLSQAEARQIDGKLRPSLRACLDTARSTRSIEVCNLAEINWQQAKLDLALVAFRAGLHSPAARADFDRSQAAWTEETNQTCGALGRRRGTMWAVQAQLCFLNQSVLRRIALESGRP